MKFKTIALTLLAVSLGAGGASFGWYKMYEKNMAEANATVDSLNATINSIGSCVNVYTVAQHVRCGTEIKPEDLVVKALPSSMVTESWVVSPAQVEGMYYKVNIEPGTPLTMDLVMADQIDDTTREYDVCFDYWPVGLKEGDYVDVRLILPYGEDYIVIPKLRIEKINETSIKVLMSEEYWNIYQSALVDYYLHLEQGASIYLTKYVEPGVQNSALAYYAVRENIRAMMLLNPNIVNLASDALNEALRASVNNALDAADANTNKTNEMEQSAINSGRDAFSANINADYVKNDEEESSSTAAVAEGGALVP